ncbi:MAG: DUF3899 domain-containing protein [Eubacteriales bacterium]|nr:DUF3899 domain-containing protein [Eubacteriales bacterium]
MKKKYIVSLTKYTITVGIGSAISYLVYNLYGAAAGNISDKYRILCDAFTIPGILMLMSGLLVWVSTMGAFDTLAYAFSWAFNRLIPGLTLKSNVKFYDYIERKKNNRIKGYSFLFICGLAFLLISVVFLILFYTSPYGDANYM